MDAILNNPFRILGLSSSATDVEIKERYTFLINNLKDIEKIVEPIDRIFNKIEIDGKSFLSGNNSHHYSSDEPGFQPHRSLNNITDAYAKLQDPINKAFYSFFAFDLKTFDDSNLSIEKTVENWINKYQINDQRIFLPSDDRDIITYDFKSIKNDKYIIEKGWKEVKITNLTENKGNLIKTANDYSSYLKDIYSISFECEWIDGIENNSFGIYFGKDPSKSSFYTFGVSANGYIYLSNTNEGQQIINNNFFGWRKVESLNGKKKNSLEIKKNKNSLDFLLNQILVHKIETQIDFYGVEMGFLIYGSQTAKFSNFQINLFKEDIAFAGDLQVSKYNFSIFKNLSIYYFLKAVLCNNIQVYKSINGYTNEISKTEYCPSLSQYNFDKAILLFGKLILKLNLNNTNILSENGPEIHSKIISNILKEILSFLLICNNETVSYKESISKIVGIDEHIKEALSEIIKKLLKESLGTEKAKEFYNDLLNLEILSLKEYSIRENFFIGTVNNPFRVLGLSPYAKEKEIIKRGADLLIYTEMNKILSYKNDMFFGKVLRTVGNIKEATKKLDDSNLRLYYSLLWFIEENKFDFEFLYELRKINNIENEDDFKNLLISRFDRYISEKISYDNAVNDISKSLYLRLIQLPNEFRYSSNIKVIKETFEFTVHEYITEKLTHHQNIEKSSDGIELNNPTGDKIQLFIKIYFDKDVDFIIECDVERLNGNNLSNEYSFIFGKGEGENFYQFGSSADGIVFFHEIIEGKVTNLLLANFKKIVVDSKTNWKLKYNKSFNCFNLIINDSPIKLWGSVLETDRIGIKNQVSYGDYIGIESVGFQKLKFSNFKINYPVERSVFANNIIVNEQNYSSLINLITEQLSIGVHSGSQVFREILTPISLFGILLNHNSFNEHAKKVLGEIRNIDIEKIERYFADDIYTFLKPHIDSRHGINKKEYFNSFYSFSDSTQKYVLNHLFGKKIIEIEEAILKTDSGLKQNPLEGIILGQTLNYSTKNNLLFIRDILTYTNYQYRALANNIADKIIDCAVIYFNALPKKSELTLSEVVDILSLIEYADRIVLGGNARKRVDENLSFFKNQIYNNLGKIQLSTLIERVEIFFENNSLKTKTTNDIKSLIAECKICMAKLMYQDGIESLEYTNFRNALINRTLTCLIDRLAEIERSPMNHKIDQEIRYGLLLDQGLEVFKELNEIPKNLQTQQRLDKYTRIFQDKLKKFNDPIIITNKFKSTNNTSNATKTPEANNQKNAQPKGAHSSPPSQDADKSGKDGLHKFKNSQFVSIVKHLLPIVLVMAGMLTLIISVLYFLHSKDKQPAAIDRVAQSESRTRLMNGSVPYMNIFGQGIFDYNSPCWLVLKNDDLSDAVVCLVNAESGNIARNTYIQAGTKVKILHLPTAQYKVRIIYGNDWNPLKFTIRDAITGGFEKDVHLSISENENDWLKVYNNSLSFYTAEITLHSLNLGSKEQENIAQEEFFK